MSSESIEKLSINQEQQLQTSINQDTQGRPTDAQSDLGHPTQQQISQEKRQQQIKEKELEKQLTASKHTIPSSRRQKSEQALGFKVISDMVDKANKEVICSIQKKINDSEQKLNNLLEAETKDNSQLITEFSAQKLLRNRLDTAKKCLETQNLSQEATQIDFAAIHDRVLGRSQSRNSRQVSESKKKANTQSLRKNGQLAPQTPSQKRSNGTSIIKEYKDNKKLPPMADNKVKSNDSIKTKSTNEDSNEQVRHKEFPDKSNERLETETSAIPD